MRSEATINRVPTRTQLFAFLGFTVMSIGVAMVAFPLSTVACVVFAIAALLSLLFFRLRIDPQAQSVIEELRLLNALTVWRRRWSLGDISHLSCVKLRGDSDIGTDAWYVFLNLRNGRKIVVREYGTRSQDEQAAAHFTQELSAQTGISLRDEASA